MPQLTSQGIRMSSIMSSRASSLAALASFTKSQASAVQQPAAIELVGRIEFVKVFNDGWGRATLFSEDGREFKLTGRVNDLVVDNDYSLTTQIKNHPKYGQSYDVLASKPYVKLNPDAMIKFIAANYDGIGAVSAKKFINAVEAQSGQEGLMRLREKLVNEPWDVDFSGIKRTGTYSIDERSKTIHSYIRNDLSTRLSGLSANVISSLADYLLKEIHIADAMNASLKQNIDKTNPVTRAWRLLSGNPYAPIQRVTGYGFLSADKIGKFVGIPRDNPARLAALASHAINEYCLAFGHVYLSLPQSLEGIKRVDASIDPQIAVSHALSTETISLDDEFGQARLYPGRALRNEKTLALTIAKMCLKSAPLLPKTANIDELITVATKSLGGSFAKGLDASQHKALKGILTSTARVHTITAEPGAGKTAVMEVLSKVLADKRFAFCAPTGKGAKVLSNRLRSAGQFASTIHSLLKGEPGAGFAINASNPLNAEIIVIDESSMPDLALATAVFEAAEQDAHIILLGDVNQLPSIDPGSVLADILAISQVDHHVLTEVHRNSGAILDVIRSVKAGKVQTISRDGTWFSGDLISASTGFDTVLNEYLRAVSRSGYEGTALLMSRRKGEVDEPGWNTTYANEKLRQACNPNGEKIPGSTIRVGDRIIIKANMLIGDRNEDEDEDTSSGQRVVNGDTGTIRGFTPGKPKKGQTQDGSAQSVNILLDDGRTIDFPGSVLSAIQLGYALTVHAAQGSEYKDVIAVITPGTPTFINRNMLYTCVSRARNTLSVYANSSDLRKIAATPLPKRNSALIERSQAALNEFDSDNFHEDDACKTHTRSRMN